MDSATFSPSVQQATLETYYRRTYGDQLAVRVASVALVSGVTAYLAVWPLAWGVVWALGYLGGEIALIAWWRSAQKVMASTASRLDRDRLRNQLILLSASLSAYAAIPCFFTAYGDLAARILGVTVAAGILLIIGAQHSLHRNMFLLTAPVGEIEAAVIEQVRHMLRAPEVIVAAWREGHRHDDDLTEQEMREALVQLDPLWEELFPGEQARVIQLLVDRVDIHQDEVAIRLRNDGLSSLAGELASISTTERIAA